MLWLNDYQYIPGNGERYGQNMDKYLLSFLALNSRWNRIKKSWCGWVFFNICVAIVEFILVPWGCDGFVVGTRGHGSADSSDDHQRCHLCN